MRGLLMVLALSGCSLGRVSSESCSTNDQCKSAFGWDAVCGDEGYCETLEMPQRCERTFPDDLWTNRRAYDDAIIFGSLYSLGYIEEVQALELPLRLMADSNATLNGMSFAMVECDLRDFDNEGLGNDQYTDRLFYTEANIAYAPWLVSELGAKVILGPDGSDATSDAYNAITSAGLEALFMAPASTSPSLTNLDGSPSEDKPGYIWRTAPSDAYQGDAMARYIFQELGIANAGVIYSTGSYGEGLLAVFRATLEELGGDATSYSYDEGEVPPTEVVERAGRGGHGAVVFIGLPDSVPAFLDAAVGATEYTSGNLRVVLADGGHSSSIYNDDPDAYAALIPYIVGTSPTVIRDSTAFEGFESEYGTAYEELSPDAGSYPAYAFDASWLMITAVTWSVLQEGEVTPTGVGRGMRNISAPLDVGQVDLNLTTTSWEENIRTAFSQGRAVNVTGATGPLDYDETTGETSAPVEVWTIEDRGGEYGFVTQGVYDPLTGMLVPTAG
jgi:branched-chain amino acid transport system substrate-binding protein